jgi:hypothetical protein
VAIANLTSRCTSRKSDSLQPTMSLKPACSAARFCAPVFRKTPPHVHPVINMAAETCPVLPKHHPTRNLQTMSSSLWSKFEKECPFAKLVQKNFGGSDAQSKPVHVHQAHPLRIYSRTPEAEKTTIVTPKPQPEKTPLKDAKSVQNHRTSKLVLSRLIPSVIALVELLSHSHRDPWWIYHK